MGAQTGGGKEEAMRVRRNTKQAVMAHCPLIAHFPLPPLIPHTLCSCDVHSNPPRSAVGVCSPIHPYASVHSAAPSSSPAPTPILNELPSQRCDPGWDSWWGEHRMLDTVTWHQHFFSLSVFLYVLNYLHYNVQAEKPKEKATSNSYDLSTGLL